MCGAGCVYIVLPQQRKERHDTVIIIKNKSNVKIISLDIDFAFVRLNDTHE